MAKCGRIGTELVPGAKWTIECLDSGFVITQEYKEHKTRAAHLDEETVLWNFCKWLRDHCHIDDTFTISFEHDDRILVI